MMHRRRLIQIGCAGMFGLTRSGAIYDEDEDADDREWSQFVLEEFFRGYSESDSIYDDINANAAKII